jgi:hypothetical protein
MPAFFLKCVVPLNTSPSSHLRLRLRPRLSAVISSTAGSPPHNNRSTMVVLMILPPPGKRLGGLSLHSSDAHPTILRLSGEVSLAPSPLLQADALRGPPSACMLFRRLCGHRRQAPRRRTLRVCCSILVCGPLCNFGIPRGPSCNMIT